MTALEGMSTPHPSLRIWLRWNDQRVLRSVLSAVSHESWPVKCARLTTKTTPPGPIAGAEFQPGRCEPHGPVGTGTVAGQGR